jgi:hypothetical protein
MREAILEMDLTRILTGVPVAKAANGAARPSVGAVDYINA